MNTTEPVSLWILAEQSANRVQRVSFELLTRAAELGQQRDTHVTAILLGGTVPDTDLQALIDSGADRVIALDAPEMTHFLPEPYARCLLALLAEEKPEILLAGATSMGRTLMPYVAVKAHTGLTADCTELAIDPATGNLLQTRPAIGGNILATIQTPTHRPQMATVRPHSTPPAEPMPGRSHLYDNIIRRAVSQTDLASRVRHVAFCPEGETHSLAEASVVVAIGRGLKKADALPAIYALADALDAAVGATRDVVDRGWLSYPHQVGLSGKTVMPRLYVAVGLSGAIQHLAGMQTAEHIIAINSDPDAPIFRLAELGLVGNLHEILPILTHKIRAAQAAAHATRDS